MLIFIPKLNSEERERKSDFLLSFSLRCSRFLSQYTRHNFLPPSPPQFHVSVILNCSLIPYTFHDSNRTTGTKFHCFMGNNNLLLTSPDRVLLWLCSLLYPPLQKSFRKAALLDYFFLSSPSWDKNFRERLFRELWIKKSQIKDSNFKKRRKIFQNSFRILKFRKKWN